MSTDNDPPETPTDYKVGYKKPPLHTRIQKGERRNPNGRPKASMNLFASLKDLLDEPVTTKDGRLMSGREASLRVLLNDAMRGNPRAFTKFMRLAKRAGLLENPDPAPELKGGVHYILRDGGMIPVSEYEHVKEQRKKQ